jgi:dolichol-phosphate mannosyltransferase
LESGASPAKNEVSVNVAARSQAQPVLTIVLPIFNEELNLGRLFDRIDVSLYPRQIGYRIVAVDDGSTDRTSDVLTAYASRIPLQVLRHSVNQGLGVAIRSGLMEALRAASMDDIVVTMDADESHTPSLIGKMLEALNCGFEVAIASRFQPGSQCRGVPLNRRILSTSASILLRTLFPTPGVRDFTCGYRAYRASALRRALDRYGDELFEFDGFQCMVDLLLKLRAVGATFTEVPVVLRYDLKEGQSKMRVFQTTVRTLRLAVRRRLGL